MKKLNNRQAHYPKEIKEAIINEVDLDYSLFLKFYDKCTSARVFVSFKCIKCGNQVRRSFKKLKSRKIINTPLCPKCVMKEACNDPGWKFRNSESQKKIQSTPEQKKKNAEGVSKFWRNNPEAKKRMGENVRAAYQKIDVRERHRKSQRQGFGLAGLFLWRNKLIEFHSSYELCFLIQTENNYKYKSIERCSFEIEYKKNNSDTLGFYWPDFLVDFNNKKYIYEIKSNWISNKTPLSNKIKASKVFVDKNKMGGFILADEDWFENNNMWIKRTARIKPIVRQLYLKNKLTLFSDKKIKRYLGCLYENKKNK